MSVDQHNMRLCLEVIFDANEDELHTIMSLVRVRREHLNDVKRLENQLEIYLGDYVKVTEKAIRPQFLLGCIGKIVQILDEGRVMVEITDASYATKQTLAKQRALYKRYNLRLEHLTRE